MRLGRRLSAGIAEDPPGSAEPSPPTTPGTVERAPEPAVGTGAESRTPDPVSSGG